MARDRRPRGVARDSGVLARADQYRELCKTADAAAVLEASRKALADRHFLLVARAASVCEERLLYGLEPDLVTAYGRLLEDAAKADPGCTAKGAIVRALVALDCRDSDFYIAGMRYRQPEPVWGGSVDAAVDLRCSCAMGLVGTPCPRAVVELVALLADPEPHARSGAARAIACAEPLAAEAVLRLKALAGDAEPEVVGDCLAGLLRVEPDASAAFVAGFLDAADPAVRDLAAVALGESRLDAALELLRERWEGRPLKREADRVLLRAAVLHRSDAAFDWLCQVVAGGDLGSAALVVEELALYRANQRLRARLAAAVERRGQSLQAIFERAWGGAQASGPPRGYDP